MTSGESLRDRIVSIIKLSNFDVNRIWNRKGFYGWNFKTSNLIHPTTKMDLFMRRYNKPASNVIGHSNKVSVQLFDDINSLTLDVDSRPDSTIASEFYEKFFDLLYQKGIILITNYEFSYISFRRIKISDIKPFIDKNLIKASNESIKLSIIEK